MAKSRIKAGGCTHGRFKPKKLGKGWSTHRRKPIPERPVIRITETERKPDTGGTDKES